MVPLQCLNMRIIDVVAIINNAHVLWRVPPQVFIHKLEEGEIAGVLAVFARAFALPSREADPPYDSTSLGLKKTYTSTP